MIKVDTIKVEIECPFALEDYVEFSKEKIIRKSVDCPFCHGKKYYNFEIKEFGDYKYLDPKKNSDSSDKAFKVIKCETCNSKGQVSYNEGRVTIFYRGFIKRVQALHYTGWKGFEFVVEEENTKKEFVVTGRELRKINKED